MVAGQPTWPAFFDFASVDFASVDFVSVGFASVNFATQPVQRRQAARFWLPISRDGQTYG